MHQVGCFGIDVGDETKGGVGKSFEGKCLCDGGAVWQEINLQLLEVGEEVVVTRSVEFVYVEGV
jgi:hypothetical protein